MESAQQAASLHARERSQCAQRSGTKDPAGGLSALAAAPPHAAVDPPTARRPPSTRVMRLPATDALSTRSPVNWDAWGPGTCARPSPWSTVPAFLSALPPARLRAQDPVMDMQRARASAPGRHSQQVSELCMQTAYTCFCWSACRSHSEVYGIGSRGDGQEYWLSLAQPCVIHQAISLAHTCAAA